MDNTKQRMASEAAGAAVGAETPSRIAIEGSPTHSAQSIMRPAGNAPWLPIPADGDPRPWPIFVLTPEQRALFLANQPPSAAPFAKGQPASTAQGGMTPANLQPRIAKAQGTGGQPIQPGGIARPPAPGPTFQGAPGPTFAPRPQPFVQGRPPGAMVHHAPQPAVRNVGQRLAVTALVLGLIALVLTCGGFGWLPGVPGFIVGMVALNRYHPIHSAPNMKAIAGWGVGLSIIASVVSLVLFIVATQTPH
jgi:hypothetical protein